MTDEVGKQRKTCTDALGRLTTVFEDPNSLNYETDYSYDALGNLTYVNQKGAAGSTPRTRSFTYDSLSRLLTASNPESGTTTYSYAVNTTTLGQCNLPLNPDGLLATKTDAAGIVTAYGYDQLHRNTLTTYSGGPATPQENRYYDQPSVYAVPLNNTKGRLSAATSPNSPNSMYQWFSYDNVGNITDEYEVTPSTTTSAPYHYLSQYNLLDSLTSLQYPDGYAVTYAYADPMGRLTSVSDNHSNTLFSAPTYWPTSALQLATLNSGSQFKLSVGYNSRLQEQSVSATATSGTLFSLNYNYNFNNQAGKNNGNVYNITNNKDSNRSVAYAYDNLNRIQSAISAGTDCSTLPGGLTKNWGQSFTIDEFGNLKQVALTGPAGCAAPVFSAAVDTTHANRLVGYEYDNGSTTAAGNMTYDGTHHYAYNARNEITAVDTSAAYYYYYVDRSRGRKKVGATYTDYTYFAGNPVAEISGGAWTDYVFALGKRFARRDSTGTVHYYLEDSLGTTRVVANQSGSTVEDDSDFYPYGGERSYVSTVPNHYKFTGKEQDAESNLDYFGARYYNSTMGRWISADWDSSPVPVPYASFSDPQTLNLYGYVTNRATSLVDADGHVIDCPVCEEVIEKVVEKAVEVAPPILEEGGRVAGSTVGAGFLILSYAVSPGTGNDTGGPNSEVAWELEQAKRNKQKPQQQNNSNQSQKQTTEEPEPEPKAEGSGRGAGRRGLPPDVVRLKGNQGFRDKAGNTWKQDKLHKDHWDVTDRKGNKLKEVDHEGRQIWPDGAKNKNKKPKRN